jgi:poly(hydroxyalkanoate) depolymerase family esterase
MALHHQNGFAKALTSRLAGLLAGSTFFLMSLLAASPASAASLTQVPSGWQQGTEPSWVSMYEYIPNTVATNPPILVVVHYCGGTASGIFGEAQGGGIISKADSEGFIMVFPQTTRNCWDVATTASLTHATGTTAGGDTKAIVDMVKYSITKHNANANRVYSIGSSSGAMMTEALLAVYPDVFKGGAEFAGVPAGCWSASYTDSNQWSSPCANGTVTKTAQQWGDLVRGMYPGYTGFRPRIQLWHGSADNTINFANQTEAVKEWTNVLGLTGNGVMSTVTISSHSYTRTQWMNSCGETVLDEWTEPSGPHGTDANMNGQYSLPFMNLDTTPFAATDPQTSCGTTTGTGGTTGGTAGTSGGTAGTSGAGTGGTTAAGGRGGSGAGGTTGQGNAGTTGQGNAGTTGQGNAGTSGQGSAGTNGGNPGSAGTTGPGIAGTNGSNPGTGGESSSGSAGTNGSSGEAGTTGSNPGTAGSDTTGSGGTAGVTTPAGCACDVSNTSSAVNALALVGLLAVMFGRRRSKRSSNEG